jgi:hypothetical protein
VSFFGVKFFLGFTCIPVIFLKLLLIVFIIIFYTDFVDTAEVLYHYIIPFFVRLHDWLIETGNKQPYFTMSAYRPAAVYMPCADR